jgi:hypothetical protein
VFVPVIEQKTLYKGTDAYETPRMKVVRATQ